MQMQMEIHIIYPPRIQYPPSRHVHRRLGSPSPPSYSSLLLTRAPSRAPLPPLSSYLPRRGIPLRSLGPPPGSRPDLARRPCVLLGLCARSDSGQWTPPTTRPISYSCPLALAYVHTTCCGATPGRRVFLLQGCIRSSPCPSSTSPHPHLHPHLHPHHRSFILFNSFPTRALSLCRAASLSLPFFFSSVSLLLCSSPSPSPPLLGLPSTLAWLGDAPPPRPPPLGRRSRPPLPPI